VKGGIMKGIQEFQVSFEGFDGKSYMTLLVPAGEGIIEYQAEMLTENRVDILLPLTVQRFNDNWKLYYDITSKVPLSKVLERKSLKYEEFAMIIKQIGKLSSILKDYLLDVYSVIFDKSLIYCDPGDLSLYFSYLPIRDNSFKKENLKDFIQTLVFKDITLADDTSGSLLKKILDALKSEDFTPDMLIRCVSPIQTEPGSFMLQDYNGRPGREINSSGFSDTGKSGQYRLKMDGLTTKTGAENHQAGINNTIINNRSKTSSLKYPVKSYIIAGSANLIMAGILFYVLLTGSNDMLSTLFGLALVGFAINYYIFSRLFAANEKTDKNEAGKIPEKNSKVLLTNEPSGKPVMQSKKTMYANSMVGRDLATAGSNAKHGEVSENHAPMNTASVRNTAVNAARISSGVVPDRTVILGRSSGGIPYLQSHSCPSERIYITKDSMLLGRLSGSVDYMIENNAVGKIHAEIIRKEDGYYIIDLNSVNGTYINQERLTCSTEVKLKSGDIITLANESYTFMV